MWMNWARGFGLGPVAQARERAVGCECGADAGDQRVERIVSHGHASAPGDWYDQDGDEWVVLLAGDAVLRFERGGDVALKAGDWIAIPAHSRHRVESTSADALWLAVHGTPSG